MVGVLFNKVKKVRLHETHEIAVIFKWLFKWCVFINPISRLSYFSSPLVQLLRPAD